MARGIRDEDDDETIDGVVCDGATAKAIHVQLPNGREAWVPLSLVRDESEVKDEGDEGKLVIAGWFYRKELE